MSADNRSVATDALETLGMIHETPQLRDAIHLAVYPVVAACNIEPGDDIGINENGLASPYAESLTGIADPFIGHTIMKGERFWLVVYPRQIRSLRHVWEHPAFPNSYVEEAKEANELA